MCIRHETAMVLHNTFSWGDICHGKPSYGCDVAEHHDDWFEHTGVYMSLYSIYLSGVYLTTWSSISSSDLHFIVAIFPLQVFHGTSCGRAKEPSTMAFISTWIRGQLLDVGDNVLGKWIALSHRDYFLWLRFTVRDTVFCFFVRVNTNRMERTRLRKTRVQSGRILTCLCSIKIYKVDKAVTKRLWANDDHSSISLDNFWRLRLAWTPFLGKQMRISVEHDFHGD